MNQKIRELAEKSGFFPFPDETESDLEYRAENARYERFAHLIIEEINKINYEVEFLHTAVKVSLENKYRVHFGIK